jgi:IS5 family transposase
MKRQISFSDVKYAWKKRTTRRERFLGEMKKVVTWQRLIETIEPFYPRGLRGRPPIGLERMLRLYFLQQWYGLADEALEDSLYDKRGPACICRHRSGGRGGAGRNDADEVSASA